jgi:hypothetical protein
MLLQIAQTQTNINSLEMFDAAIAQLFNTGGAILQIGRAWSYSAAAGALLWALFQSMMLAARGRTDDIPPVILFTFGRLTFVAFALTYYIIPIPGIGVPFPDVFTAMGRELAGAIGIASLNVVLDQINACTQGLQHPPAWNFFGQFVYWFVFGAMTMLDGALFLVVSLGFYLVGIGKVFGPILLVAYLVPGWQQKFWNWVNYMFVYSFYRPVAAAGVLVISTFLVNIFQNIIHHDYSLGMMTGMMCFLISSIVATVFLAFKTPHIAVELFGGGLGHAGSEFASELRALVYMVARRIK